MIATDTEIEAFLKGQLVAWNAGDRDGFFGAYRAAAPAGLTIDYIGQPQRDGWEILDKMWADQNDKIEVEVLKAIVNGAEAACYHRNHVRGTTLAVDTIELYSFEQGKLHIRYFIEPVAKYD